VSADCLLFFEAGSSLKTCLDNPIAYYVMSRSTETRDCSGGGTGGDEAHAQEIPSLGAQLAKIVSALDRLSNTLLDNETKRSEEQKKRDVEQTKRDEEQTKRNEEQIKHNVAQTQHNEAQTQHNVAQTQHNVAQTQHNEAQKQHNEVMIDLLQKILKALKQKRCRLQSNRRHH